MGRGLLPLAPPTAIAARGLPITAAISSVAAGFPVRNARQCPPDPELKGRALRGEIQVERASCTLEVLAQLPFRLIERPIPAKPVAGAVSVPSGPRGIRPSAAGRRNPPAAAARWDCRERNRTSRTPLFMPRIHVSCLGGTAPRLSVCFIPRRHGSAGLPLHHATNASARSRARGAQARACRRALRGRCTEGLEHAPVALRKRIGIPGDAQCDIGGGPGAYSRQFAQSLAQFTAVHAFVQPQRPLPPLRPPGAESPRRACPAYRFRRGSQQPAPPVTERRRPPYRSIRISASRVARATLTC